MKTVICAKITQFNECREKLGKNRLSFLRIFQQDRHLLDTKLKISMPHLAEGAPRDPGFPAWCRRRLQAMTDSLRSKPGLGYCRSKGYSTTDGGMNLAGMVFSR